MNQISLFPQEPVAPVHGIHGMAVQRFPPAVITAMFTAEMQNTEKIRESSTKQNRLICRLPHTAPASSKGNTSIRAALPL